MAAGSSFACVYPPAMDATLPSWRARMPWTSGWECSASMKRASREPGLLKTYLTPEAASCSTIIWDGFAVMGLRELWEMAAMGGWTSACLVWASILYEIVS